MSNTVLERFHQVLRNLMRNFNISQTYVDEDGLWTDISASAEFVIFSTSNKKNGYSPGQLIFGSHMIINGLICKQSHNQINKYSTHKNRHRMDYDYKVGDNVIITNQTAYKYETPYTGPYVITQCFTHGT